MAKQLAHNDKASRSEDRCLEMLKSTNKKTKQQQRSTKRREKAAVEGEVAGATALGAIVTEPAIQRSVMTSQSAASFKVPKRKFKAKSSRGPLKTSETGLRPKVLLDACLNERAEFETFSPADCGPLAEFRERVCLVMQRRACVIHYQAMFNLIH